MNNSKLKLDKEEGFDEFSYVKNVIKVEIRDRKMVPKLD